MKSKFNFERNYICNKRIKGHDGPLNRTPEYYKISFQNLFASKGR